MWKKQPSGGRSEYRDGTKVGGGLRLRMIESGGKVGRRLRPEDKVLRVRNIRWTGKNQHHFALVPRRHRSSKGEPSGDLNAEKRREIVPATNE